ELAFAAAQRLEGGGAVAEELPQREALAREGAAQLDALGDGRIETAERVGEVLPLTVDRHRGFLHPVLEGGAGPGVEGAEDLVELNRFGDVRLGQGSAVVELWPLARAGREFD